MMRRAAPMVDILRLCLQEGERLQTTALQRRVAGRNLAGLASAAHRHGIAGYVYRRLKEVPGVDRDTLQTLEALHEQAVRAHLQALADLTTLCRACDPVGTAWVVAGGPVLTELVHRHPGLRAYETLDVVVPDRTCAAFLDRAIGAGSRLREQGTHVGGPVPVANLVLPHGTLARVFRRLPGAGSASAPDDAGTDALLSRGKLVDLQGLRMLTFDWGGALLWLAAVPPTDPDGQLGWLKDVERVVGCSPLEWDELVGRAEAAGSAEALRRVLRAARDVLAAPVPEKILEALTSPRHEAARVQAMGAGTRTAGSEEGDGAAAVLLRMIRPDRQMVRLSPTAWEEVLGLATRERVAPLVHDAIRTEQRPPLPGAISAVFAKAYEQARADAVDAYAQLGQVLEAFREAGCVPLLMKGAALARFTYAEAALRPFNDLDLLVPLREVDAAHRALLHTGYQVAGETPTLADLTWRHARGYFDPAGLRMPVDLHWRFTGYPLTMALDRPGVFRRAVEVRIGGEPALLPTPGDMVVAVSIAFLRELWYCKPRLRYLRDLAEIVSRHPVDWDLVLRVVAETPPVRSPVYLALGAAVDLLGAPVPTDMLDRLPRPRSRHLARRLRAHVAQRALGRDDRLRAVLQVALMRWLDRRSAGEFLRSMRSLVLVPPPLADSQRRWWRMLKDR